MKQLLLVVDNIRSTHNVGSILRTADGLGIHKVYLCGTTPYPRRGPQETRLPHEVAKVTAKIHKTALGAEQSVAWEYATTTHEVLKKLAAKGVFIAAVEQDDRSIALHDFITPSETVALVLGPEVTGINKDILALCDAVLEIPMKGTKESLNVSVAAAIAAYELLRPSTH
jgi:23S rRNA (guanosine2251-2'-O)-methyltransferase